MNIVWGIGTIVALLQIFVSILVVRSHRLEPRQKFLQFMIVWALPVLGAAVVWAMLQSDDRKPYVPEKGYTTPNDSGASE